MSSTTIQRRRFIKSSALGIIGITSFGTIQGKENLHQPVQVSDADSLFYRYPSMDDTMVSGIVGASHGNFDKVKELVNARPELAGASWDWGFGDWETALGAASHVGRRDIAEFLIANGARPDIFKYTMMGMLKSVQEIIETKEGLYRDEILILNNLAQQMRNDRFKNGAISFSSQEVRFKLDENNKPIGIMIKESKEAHQLIEEFMLLANRTVAENLGKIKINDKPVPFPYRIHDNPDEEKLLPFIAFAKKFGHQFDISSPDAIAGSFNQMLKDVHGKPEQHVLEQLGIRTMAKARYTTENVGHYGLGFDHS